MKKEKFKNGFTFIELLVTMTIVSILMATAFPSYDKYIKESHANALKIHILDMANDFEKIKRKNLTYKAILNADQSFNTSISELSYPVGDDNKRFNLTVSNVTHVTYKIEATPVGVQGDDYGKIKLEFINGEMIGTYDYLNDESFLERWY